VPSDIADAVNQDAVADSLVAPIEAPAAQDTGTEEGVETESQEASQEVTEEATGTEAEDTDWLPDEQQKVFPQEVVSKYGTRYGYTAEEIQADPRLQRTLNERMNQDIYIAQLRKDQELQDLVEPEDQQGPTPQQTQPLPTLDQHFQRIDELVRQKTDPVVAQKFNADFLRAFNVPEDEIAKVSPEQAMKFTSTVSKYMLNLISTFAADVIDPRLGQGLEQAFPQFGQMYERATYANAWDAVRNSDEAFISLPAFGTKEFRAALKDAATALAGSPERFEEMQFREAKGPADNARMKYELLAKQIIGKGVNPALVKQAVETGMKKGKAQAAKQAGNLGAPVTPKAASAKSGSPQFTTNTDIFDDVAMGEYVRQHGNL